MEVAFEFPLRLCAFAREKPLAFSPDDSASEDVIFVSRQGAKAQRKFKGNRTKVRRRVLGTPPGFMVYRPRRTWGLGFAREKVLASSLDDWTWEDTGFVSRKGAKPAKKSQRRKTPIQKPCEQPGTSRSFRRGSRDIAAASRCGLG
jgi:hypothetical protein